MFCLWLTEKVFDFWKSFFIMIFIMNQNRQAVKLNIQVPTNLEDKKRIENKMILEEWKKHFKWIAVIYEQAGREHLWVNWVNRETSRGNRPGSEWKKTDKKGCGSSSEKVYRNKK